MTLTKITKRIKRNPTSVNQKYINKFNINRTRFISFQLYLKIKPVKQAYKITKFEKCYSKNLRKNTDNLGFFLFPRLHHFKAELCFEKLLRYSIKSFNGPVKKKLHFLVQSQVYSYMPNIETVAQMYCISIQKVPLNILQNSQESTYVETCSTLLKKNLQHTCFPVNFAKFLM